MKIRVYLKSILLTLYKRTYIIEIEQVHAIVHVCVYGQDFLEWHIVIDPIGKSFIVVI